MKHIHSAIPLFLLPLADSFFTSLPFPFTYLETLFGVIGSRPPWSQVTCKLTSPFSTPPLSQPLPIPSPFQIPVTQVNCAPYYDDIVIPASHGPEHTLFIYNLNTILLLAAFIQYYTHIHRLTIQVMAQSLVSSPC